MKERIKKSQKTGCVTTYQVWLPENTYKSKIWDSFDPTNDGVCKLHALAFFLKASGYNCSKKLLCTQVVVTCKIIEATKTVNPLNFL